MKEATARELVTGSIRKGDFTPKTIQYLGFSFRSKLAYFKTGDYQQKVKIPDIKVVSKIKGTDKDKVSLAIDSDVEVYCTCADFLYGGFQYIGTQLSYSTNKETRPPVNNNPTMRGTVCKHLTYLLDKLPTYSDEIVKDIEKSRGSNYKSVMRDHVDKLIDLKVEGFDIEFIIND